MAKRLGKYRMLDIYTSVNDAEGEPVAEAYFPVACLTSSGITFTNSTIEGTVTKCDDNPETTYGGEAYTYNADGENMADDGVKASFDAVYEARKKSIDEGGYVYWRERLMSPSNTLISTKFGKGIIPELSMESPADGAETFNFTIQGVGEISATDLHV